MLNLEPGITALPIDLRNQAKVGWREMINPGVAEAAAGLKALFESIRDQGGDVLCVVPLTVLPKADGYGLPEPEVVPFVVVEKK